MNPPPVSVCFPSGGEAAWLHSREPWLPGFLWVFVGAHCFWSCASEEEQRIRRRTYTPFSPLLAETTPLHHASSPSLTLPKSQALTLLECLAPKEADSSLPMTHWFGLIVPWSFVFLSFVKRAWSCIQIVSTLLTFYALKLIVNSCVQYLLHYPILKGTVRHFVNNALLFCRDLDNKYEVAVHSWVNWVKHLVWLY